MTTRFAPSPTGRLHCGHAYAARFAHDLARAAQGSFLLRFEDIDHTRVRPEFYPAIEDDLRWLGLGWDAEPLRQSDRLAAYAAALRRLHRDEMVYPCFCTRRAIRDELARMAHAPHGPEGPLYPGTCRQLPPTVRARRISRGDPHCWRLDTRAAHRATGPLTFVDDRLGSFAVDPALMGDVVLARKDIATSYHLAVVVDDAHQAVTHVTRGEDLLAATHVHRTLQALLGLPEPRYHHHRLITDDQGTRLATRDHPASLQHLRSRGLSPEDILRRLASPDPPGPLARNAPTPAGPRGQVRS